jgi:apolipoprotein N-acyltransferase
VWLTYLGHDGVNIARALLVGIGVFLLLVRLALAERERVLAHFGAVLVLASLLESAWIQYVSALGRGWIFGLVEMLLAAVLAYFVSLLLVMREKNRQR